MGDIDFEEQIELERLEKEKKDGHQAEKVDPDGTVYEWDYDKKAWFPKIDAAFIAQYQMNYGLDVGTGETKTEETPTDATAPQSYQDYYNSAQAAVQGVAGEAGDTGAQGEYQEDSPEAMAQYTEEQKKQYNEYWSYYYGTDHHDYYTDCLAQHSKGNQGEGSEAGTEADELWKKWKDDHGHTSENVAVEKKEEDKKGKKRKKPPPPKREEGWFSVEEKHNTNVYISGLPPDMTEEEFQELMAKYGLIMFDPRTKKPKAKLYVDGDGKPKGDGRCCYIKRESVDLALNLLDGLDIRGHTVKVEMATFKLKGDYDPAKKKKKMTNKEKNRMRERQSKLFDWRPDKPRNARAKHEKVVVLKNIFDAKVFEDNPALINKVSADMRTECEKYGTVKKVVVYDRHQDGVVIVHYKEAEEADMCVDYMDKRFMGDRRVLAETWDGTTKYEVLETEAEREARLKKWEQYLEAEEEERKTAAAGAAAGVAATAGSGLNGASATGEGNANLSATGNVNANLSSTGNGNANLSATTENNSNSVESTTENAESTGEGESKDIQMGEAVTTETTVETQGQSAQDVRVGDNLTAESTTGQIQGKSEEIEMEEAISDTKRAEKTVEDQDESKEVDKAVRDNKMAENAKVQGKGQDIEVEKAEADNETADTAD